MTQIEAAFKQIEPAFNFIKNQPIEKLKQRLNETKESINFLESIYMTGAKNNFYSNTFADAAYKERQSLCLLSSKIHTLIRQKESLNN
jgi:hypothetical protein